MATLIDGTVLATIDTATINAQFFSNASFVDDTHLWIASNFAWGGSLWKVPLSNFVAAQVTQVYPIGFFAPTCVSLWRDETKVYWETNVSGVHTVRSALLDGSSSTFTIERTGIVSSSNFWRPVYENGIHYFSNGLTRSVRRMIMGSGASLGVEDVLTTTNFLRGLGPCRYRSNSLLVSQSDSVGYYICDLDLRQGHLRAIAGNGSTGTIVNGPAFNTPLGDTISFLSSDEDGRVYFLSGGSLYSIIDGTLSQRGTVTSMNVMSHSLAANRIVLSAGYIHRLIA